VASFNVIPLLRFRFFIDSLPVFAAVAQIILVPALFVGRVPDPFFEPQFCAVGCIAWLGHYSYFIVLRVQTQSFNTEVMQILLQFFEDGSGLDLIWRSRV
jgi:hypothetical protein